ncbi:MAG: hypothetical protein ACO25F_02820 [Erythrobacter sp.]
MKKIIIVSALALVAGCSQPEGPAAEAEANEKVAEAAPGNIAADGGPSVGSYKITHPDGTVYTEELRADGTYTSTASTGEVESGKWVQKSPELYCTTVDQEGATERCSNEKVDANGVWTSTDPEGETVTVERVEA